MTSGYTYVDFDNDGDMDIVTQPVSGTTQFFVNELASGNSIVFELRDEIDNHHGIGAVVSIEYGPEASRRQMREIQMGGGFVSFDAANAHFGLGDFGEVTAVEIRWPDQSVSRISDPLAAGARYVISRKSTAVAAAQ